jgi:hypothetical protein
MKHYKNLGGNSGVEGYEAGMDSITVQFKDGASYLYTYASAGASNIETMKQLADGGVGLNSFITRNVRNAYQAKSR